MDAHKNFALSTVATAPSPAGSGTSLVVTTGHGVRFPTPPFNVTIWPAGAQPDPGNAEIARCTAIATDTLTLVRAQEGSVARTVVVGDQIAATVTAKTLQDVENPPAVRVTKSATQSLTTAVETVLTYDVENFDTDGMHDNVTNNSRLTANRAGKYLVVGSIDFATNTTGNRSTRLRKNGTTTLGTAQQAANGPAGDPLFQVMAVVHLAVGDYVEQLAYQNSGGNLNVETTDTSLAAVYLGA